LTWSQKMTLLEFNNLPNQKAEEELFKCCGSKNWAKAMLDQRPFRDLDEIDRKATALWMNCDKQDFLEAFTHHPRIGNLKSLEAKFGSTSDWASEEQGSVATAQQKILEQLASANDHYLEKFGYIFIVFATGKSAPEMLEILKKRLNNDPDQEMKIASGEQMKITLIRLKKLLS